MTKPFYLRVALPVPLRQCFDYLPPKDLHADKIARLRPGTRLLVPFGKRSLVGILMELSNCSDYPRDQLKPAHKLLEDTPLLTPDILSLCQWAANYYQHPLGEVVTTALPTLLRKGQPIGHRTETHWRLSDLGKGLPDGALSRAPKQARLLAALQQHPSINRKTLQFLGISRQIINQLVSKRLAESFEQSVEPAVKSNVAIDSTSWKTIVLHEEQQQAVSAVKAALGVFHCFLLNGVTGSGKTEVYLQLIATVLQRNQQALVLIPEIGLTPQTLSRFQNRFAVTIALIHSGLNEQDRARAWQDARQGKAQIVIGTRSALFTPMPNLGLIVIDEEHDASFKQQEGFRYSARDTAVMRARRAKIPIILGSATPSLESIHNAQQDRYSLLRLTERAGQSAMPGYQVVDIRHATLQEGISDTLIQAIRQTLDRQNQVLVFLNRRGYAPTLICDNCGWVAHCKNCDSRMTVHHNPEQLQCHHCEATAPTPKVCSACQSRQLVNLGQGTQRSEAALKTLFPQVPIVRIDRNTTSTKNALNDKLSEIEQGQACILVGTQMLAKGHHFPKVTLAALLDADASLYSSDFRGPERMGQLLTQVAGRAGRGEQPGQVIIQTRLPDNPLLQSLLESGYDAFAAQLLAERRLTDMPPYYYLAILRTEAQQAAEAETLLVTAEKYLNHHFGQLETIGPLPATLARRAGKYRFMLLIKSANRSTLNQGLAQLTRELKNSANSRRTKLSIDVDPQETL
jgi:primosomal protein N' (replication factor Y)